MPCFLGSLQSPEKTLSGVLVQEHVNLPKLGCKIGGECTHLCISLGRGSLASSAGSVDPQKGKRAAPSGSQASVTPCCAPLGLWSFLRAPSPSHSQTSTGPPRPRDLLSALRPQGPCTHPARSDSASSPRLSPGRPCCSHSACEDGGWAHSARGHTSLGPALTPFREKPGLIPPCPLPLSGQHLTPQPLSLLRMVGRPHPQALNSARR